MATYDSWGLDTLACRAGVARTNEQEHSEPIFPTSSFVFESAEQAAARFAGEQAGNIYSRFTNPTVRTFEARLAALEGGERALATASGMAAILTLALGVLKAGDHVVAARALFGTTVSMFHSVLSRFGVETTFVGVSDLDDWRGAMRENTRLMFVETPSNPLNEVADIAALAELARAHNALLAVDNCFCTPALQRPLALGADIIVHSATKFLDGQGRCVGGALVGSAELIDTHLLPILRTCGTTMSPFNAWVFSKGLETLSLRMERHCRSADRVAAWLDAHPKVRRVFHLSLASGATQALARRQQSGNGAIVAFEVAGDRASAFRVIDSVRIFSITANLGDAKSTITHPATTTHGRLTDAQRETVGIAQNLIRLSVGLEDVEDLIHDLEGALQHA